MGETVYWYIGWMDIHQAKGRRCLFPPTRPQHTVCRSIQMSPALVFWVPLRLHRPIHPQVHRLQKQVSSHPKYNSDHTYPQSSRGHT